MRKMLNTLFVLTEDARLSLKDQNVVVRYQDDSKRQIPLLSLENIISFSHMGASVQLMNACTEKHIGLAFCDSYGHLLARISGESRGNVLLRRQQYRLADDEAQRVFFARNFISGKIYNSTFVLKRFFRDHSFSLDKEKFANVIHELGTSLHDLRKTSNTSTLRGIEGNAAQTYFSVFGDMILKHDEAFAFHGRVRRPPDGPVNSMLSFGYTLLAHDCATALESVGLDAYVGFLHTDRAGRVSLALDLMEELRSVFVDRLVLSLINKQSIRAEDFTIEDGNVLFTDKGRKIFLNAWQTKKHTLISHPFTKEKFEWGLVPYAQSLLLARTIRGDLPEYPAFLWKI